MGKTQREIFEEEVNIVARKGKKIKFLNEFIVIKGIPWYILEDIGESIIKIFQPMMDLAVRSVGAGGSTAGTDQLTVSLNALDPAIFTHIGEGTKETIQTVIKYGSDADWEKIRKYDFAVVAQLAVEILKYNMGPSLVKNLSNGVSDLLKGFGVPLMPSVQVTPTSTSDPSSLNSDTKVKK